MMNTRLAVALLLVACACKQRGAGSTVAENTAAEDTTNAEKPAVVTYHFGDFDSLRPYDNTTLRSGEAMPPTDWKKIKSNAYPIGYRRGFYVSNHPAYNERYAAEYLREKNSPWLLQVELDSACTEFAGPSVLDLIKSQNFQQFLTSHPQGPAFRNCPASTFSQMSNAPICHQIVSDFIDSKGYRLLYDHIWPGSGFWIVRDPTCIRAIKTDEASILRMFAEVKGIWNLAPYTTGKLRDMQGKGSQGHVLFAVLIRALSKIGVWDPDLLAAIKANVSTQDIEEMRSALPLLMDLALHCKSQGEEDGMRDKLHTFVEAVTNKTKLNPVVISFTGLISNLVNSELGSSCRGASEYLQKHPGFAYFHRKQTASCFFSNTSCYEWIWYSTDTQQKTYLKDFCGRNNMRYSDGLCTTSGRTAGRCARRENIPLSQNYIYFYGVSQAEARGACPATEYEWQP